VLTERWFKHFFVPNAIPSRVDEKKPMVLTLDGHDSHETPGMQQTAYDNSIILLCLPSKIIHKLQPLDVAVFFNCGGTWAKNYGRLLAEGVMMNRYNVIHEYYAIQLVMTPGDGLPQNRHLLAESKNLDRRRLCPQDGFVNHCACSGILSRQGSKFPLTISSDLGTSYDDWE